MITTNTSTQRIAELLEEVLFVVFSPIVRLSLLVSLSFSIVVSVEVLLLFRWVDWFVRFALFLMFVSFGRYVSLTLSFQNSWTVGWRSTVAKYYKFNKLKNLCAKTHFIRNDSVFKVSDQMINIIGISDTIKISVQIKQSVKICFGFSDFN